MSLHNRLDYAAEGRNRCQTRIGHRIICAEDTVEAVKIGVPSPEERLWREQVTGERGGSAAVRKSVQRPQSRVVY